MKLIRRLSVRRAFPFLLAVLLLFFSGCMPREKAEAYEQAEDWYKRYVTDTQDTLHLTYDEQLAQMWCCYARYPNENDFGPHNLPDDLYDYPVNVGAHYIEDGSRNFANNSDTLAVLGDEGVQEIIDHAKAYWEQLWSVDYRYGDKETYRMEFLWYYSPYIKKKDYMSDWSDNIYDNHYIVKSVFVSDPSAVYTAEDGSYRVRGIGYIQFYNADDAADIADTVEIGIPYYTYVEFGFMPIDDAGQTPAWEHGPWHTSVGWRFTQWTVSQDADINADLAILPDA